MENFYLGTEKQSFKARNTTVVFSVNFKSVPFLFLQRMIYNHMTRYILSLRILV